MSAGIAGWAIAEARALLGFLRERQLWAALAAGLLAWALAYQAPFSYQLDIGGDQGSLGQKHDAPFLRDFNDPEPPDRSTEPQVTPYRWTQDRSMIVLPGVGGSRWRVAIRASSGRPDGRPTASRWSDGFSTTELAIGGGVQRYYLAAETDAGGDLRLRLDTRPLDAPADPRTLGMVLFQLKLEPTGGPYLPAPRQVGLLALALALAYMLARRLALGPRGALALAVGLAAIAALLLMFARMALTLATPQLPAILAGCYALGLLGDVANRRVLAATLPGGHAGQPLVMALVALALAARLAGMLHPYAIFSDAGLNTNNLIELVQGKVLFTEGLPSESGGGQAPYPPGQYIVLAPFQLLLVPGRDALTALEKIGNALADSLAVGLIWYLLRRGGYPERTTLLGAALYVLPPPMLKSLSVGEFANVFGQALALPLLAYAALSARRLAEPRVFAGLAVLLALALLGHLGVTISLVCLMGYLGLVWLVRPATRQATRALTLAGLLAGGLVALVYYAPLADVLMSRVGARPPADAAHFTLAQRLANELNLTAVLRLHPLIVALGAAGAALVAFRPQHWAYPWPRPTIGALLMAWWGGTLLSLGLLLFASQGVRWQAFLYPALCLGAGPALARLWARGRAGRLVAIGVFGFLLWNGVDYWIVQIYTYLH